MSSIKEAIKKVPGVERLYLKWRGVSDPGIRSRLTVLESLPKRSTGVEIGVHEGDYAAKILNIVKPSRLHLVDPWLHFEETQYERSHYGGLGSDGQRLMDERYERVCRRFDAHIRSGIVSVHRLTSDDAVAEFENESLDWVYIDGNHQYEFVLNDLRHYFPKVRKGGIIAGDDYGAKDWWGNGVQEAVDEFLREHKTLVLETNDTQFIIRK